MLNPLPLGFEIRLKNLHCFEEGDGIGSSEPYLWAIFFKIDGNTVFVDEKLALQGTVSFITTNLGDHGDLDDSDVDAGDDVPIPQQFGYGDILTPIPLKVPILETTHVGGIVGCLVVLLEENSTADSAVAEGHAKLRIAVEDALNKLIPTLNILHQSPTEDEIKAFKQQIESEVHDAVAHAEGLLDPALLGALNIGLLGIPGWISGGFDMDSSLGSEAFQFSQEDLLDAGPGGKVFKRVFDNQGINLNPLDDYTWLISGVVLAVWSAWEDLGGPPAPPVVSPLQDLVTPPGGPRFGQQLVSAPAAVSWGPNRIDCFGRGIDLHMWHKWWDGTVWSDWEDLGGILTSAPSVASWGPNRLDCFVRGTNNHMWHKWWDGLAWSEWEDLGGILTSAPAAVSWGTNRVDCFVRGTNNHMWHKWWDGSAWSNWEDLGGFLTTAPAVASLKENRLDCFARGTQNHMIHKWWDGTAWSEWEDLGGSLKDTPAAVSWGPQRIDCFVRDTNNHMSHIWWGQ
ncbi:MAG TPA: hypothetical protein VK206_25315 [Anaerolineales bacterium]|nr:hypothetical protein [Anaerolineales bacterium]